MRSIGRDPLFIARGEGAEIFDVDGNGYIDYVCSWGPLIAGHAHPQVIAAVTDAAGRGTSFGAPTEGEIQLAAEVVERVPSAEMVRMTSSGTEASMSAIRLARAATGRDPIVKFAGAYHGHVDGLLAEAGSGLATQGEPFPANMGLVPPGSGFLEFLRKAADAAGAVLIFDEVISGFRVSRGGAQERTAITPDLTILGKVMGGGLPAAAYAGPRTFMEMIAPAGDVYQAGTLSGNPLAVAAGLATLELLDDSAYTQLERTTRALAQGLAAIGQDSSVPLKVTWAPGLLTLFFTDGDLTNLDDVRTCDLDAHGAFCREMLELGIYLPPSQYEAWFPSLAHTDEHVERTLEAARRALS